MGDSKEIQGTAGVNRCIEVDSAGFRRFLEANPEAIAWNWPAKMGWFWDCDGKFVRWAGIAGTPVSFDDAFGEEAVFKFIPCNTEVVVFATRGSEILSVLNILVNAVSLDAFGSIGAQKPAQPRVDAEQPDSKTL